MFQSIVVGTDGSQTAGEAVREAVELAKARRGPDRPRVRVRAGRRASGCARRRARRPRTCSGWSTRARTWRRRCATAAERVEDAGRDVTTYAREGDPADAILDVAEERGSDLIVVGNKGMTGAKRFLLGSVPNKVSHHAPCSVLIIRTTWA